jgi:hypothetical protein
MSERPQFDPVSPFCRDVLAVFRDALAEVRFPELDRQRLEDEAAAASDAQLEVEQLERELEAARLRTREASARLARSAEQALAYARVYALAHPEVGEVLASLDAPRTTAEAPKLRKPRGPRAKKDEGALLPIEADAAE